MKCKLSVLTLALMGLVGCNDDNASPSNALQTNLDLTQYVNFLSGLGRMVTHSPAQCILLVWFNFLQTQKWKAGAQQRDTLIMAFKQIFLFMVSLTPICPAQVLLI